MGEEQRKTVLDFLRRHKHGVLSTVSLDGRPESAAIEFGVTGEVEIIFDTYITYRKYKNLQTNSRVAFVVWEEDVTVQYEGDAIEISDVTVLKQIKTVFFSQVPEAKKFDQAKDVRFFKVSPIWIRYRDYKLSPEPLFEVVL